MTRASNDEIRILTPSGGGTDFTARLVAEKLTARLGQTVLVENKPGPAAISAPRRRSSRRPTATPTSPSRAATPSRMNRELDAVLKSPEVSNRLADDGVIAVGGPPDTFMTTIRTEVERWQTFNKRTGVKLE